MALPYKLFKSLTINGQTQGLDPDLGIRLRASTNTAITSTNVDTQGATLTLDEPGAYLIYGAWRFGPGTSTANRTNYLTIKTKSSGGSWASGVIVNNWGVGTNTSYLLAPYMAIVEENQVPCEVAVFGTSNQTSAQQPTTLIITKIPKMSE